MVANWAPQLPVRRGRTPRVPLDQLLSALTFHVMHGAGTLAEHFFELFQEPLANSSWSDRRVRLPWEIFADLMRRALRPIATRRQQPEAFWRGWRLLAIDGTQYSVTNTPQVAATTTKAASRRGRAAFAKLGVAVLLELGVHNPRAAAIARKGESELALARQLFAQLPKGALLLADRLYGVPAVIVEVWAACRRVGSHFLFRIPRNITSRVGPLENLLTARQKDQVVKRGEALMRRCITGKRRSRTNPRAVRQPVRRWPRLMETHSVEGPLLFKVV
jgi:hypothetical protein